MFKGIGHDGFCLLLPVSEFNLKLCSTTFGGAEVQVLVVAKLLI